jgi:alanyl aminopeptidase
VQLVLADLGDDADLRRDAAGLVARHLAEPGSVPRPAVQVAMPIAALDGDAAFVDRIVAALGTTSDSTDRAVLLSGLGGLRDPALYTRALDLYLTDAVRAGEYRQLVGRGSGRRGTAAAGFAWLTTHFDAVAKKVGEFGTAYLPYGGVGFCDAADRVRVAEFFGDPAHQRVGATRVLAQVLEIVDECVRLRARAVPAVTTYLAATAQP